MSFCYIETIMSDNEKLPFLQWQFDQPNISIISQIKNFVCEI